MKRNYCYLSKCSVIFYYALGAETESVKSSKNHLMAKELVPSKPIRSTTNREEEDLRRSVTPEML
jgi:hypothetical protein